MAVEFPGLKAIIVISLVVTVLVLEAMPNFMFPLYVSLKLDGLIEWSWWKVFTPIWFNFVGLVVLSFALFFYFRERFENVRTGLTIMFILLGALVFLFIFAYLVCERLAGENDYLWTTIFLPIFALQAYSGLLCIVFYLKAPAERERMSDPKRRVGERAPLIPAVRN
eukprot:gnl/Hemi2/13277_TR4550_c0_g1_i1.p1 gnl/Hemi2/13277_TR4550_c0_g1~~gnl/Hemi2/13277_TR4550_c0_g1_i1.p1  ORF type:complete len:167 (+),score=48.72 gnl/Hemi2/13277_TR4550_c0_g1_i1:108-608(+)